jgi:hypothetical protein
MMTVTMMIRQIWIGRQCHLQELKKAAQDDADHGGADIR